MTLHDLSCILEWHRRGGLIYKIEFYQTPGGDYPAKDFLETLPENVRGKAAKWFQLLQEKGSNLPRPYADVLAGPIRELRLSFGRLEIRLLYFIDKKKIVVTHGFLKKTDKVDRNEIERAERYRNDWKKTFGGES